MGYIYSLDTIGDIDISISRPCTIFLYGDLGSGKTTLSSSIIRKILQTDTQVTSPTYVYYNKYEDVHHFDLYRMGDYDEFISIGGEEIFDNNDGIILVEWPELISSYYTADISIYMSKVQDENKRKIKIIYANEK